MHEHDTKIDQLYLNDSTILRSIHWYTKGWDIPNINNFTMKNCNNQYLPWGSKALLHAVDPPGVWLSVYWNKEIVLQQHQWSSECKLVIYFASVWKWQNHIIYPDIQSDIIILNNWSVLCIGSAYTFFKPLLSITISVLLCFQSNCV